MSYIPAGAISDHLVKVERETDAREITRAIRFVRAIDDEFVSLQRKNPREPEKSER